MSIFIHMDMAFQIHIQIVLCAKKTQPNAQPG